jgi:hypothetical protein
MKMRSRKLIGTLAMLIFVMVYALVAIALAQGRVTDAPKIVQLIVYAALGLGWIIPAGLMIRWMERPDPS